MEPRSGDFHPGTYSDVPLYNIQAVASATGVPAITLRSWERRYGIPEPNRDPKGYRLYSDRDVAVTRWLKERVRQGVGISRAVNMLRVLERGELANQPASTLDFDMLRKRLLDAIHRMDEAGVATIIGEALMVGTVEDVSLLLLQPTLYDVGTRWQAGHLSVTSEHVCSNLIRAHLVQLTRLMPSPLRSERVLVGGAPGELHDIGALMFALFLRRRGFDVVFIGASVESASLQADVSRLQPAVVCLSASTTESAHALAGVFESMSGGYSGLLAFGGRIYQSEPELAKRTLGTYLGENAQEAVQYLERLLAEP